MITPLFLPGNMCDARLWAPVGARLGLPTAPVGDLSRQTGIEAMATDMLAQHPGPLVPIGFSMGAIVALQMAQLAPARIAGLALVAVNAAADLPERAAVRPRQQQDVLTGRLPQVVADELKPNYLAAANRADQGLRQLLLDMALGLGADVFVRQSEALRTRADLRPVLPTLTVPVLLACGDEDRLCPPSWHARWAAMIGGPARLHTIANAGHMLPLEQPEALADALRPWLTEIEETTCRAS